MKKIILLFLGILNVLTIVSCKKEKVDINTPKEFKTGDIVIYNGVKIGRASCRERVCLYV